MHKWHFDQFVKLPIPLTAACMKGAARLMAKLRVLILFGGTSNYDESRRSAAAVLRALPADQYEFVPVGINKRGRWLYFPGDRSEIENNTWDQNPDCTPAVLSPDPAHGGILILDETEYTLKRIDVIFSLLHGQFGEDGSLQGFFELTRIPYVGNGVLGAAVCRSKVYTHRLLDGAGIPTPKWVSVDQRQLSRLEREYERIEQTLEYPMYIKPARSDSAQASRIVRNRSELAAGVKLAFTHDSTVLIEEYIAGREFRIGVFGYDLPFASFVGEICPGHGENGLIIPAELDEQTAQFMRETAISAYCALDCKGLALLDIYYTEERGVLVGEANTLPGLYKHASYPLLMADLGMRYPYLLQKLIEQAIEHADRGI